MADEVNAPKRIIIYLSARELFEQVGIGYLLIVRNSINY